MGRVFKGVVNLDSGGNSLISCGWSDCERQGLRNYTWRQCEHQQVAGTAAQRDRICEAVDAGQMPGRHARFVFCTERHRLYFTASTGAAANRLSAEHGGRIHGMLPVGSRGLLG